jgi:hypothetical protein
LRLRDPAVTPRLERFGAQRTPVMVLDGAGPAISRIVEFAAALGPFPVAGVNYPGVRRTLCAGDGAAYDYMVDLLESAAPYIGGAFDLDGFDLIEASFSLVTTPPEALTPVQRAPHFDTTEPNVFAVLHYLAETEGTAFFRHRASGVETVSPENVESFVAAARRTPAPAGYISASNAYWERVGMVEGRAGRLVAYPGRTLHSGLIPPDFIPSADPRLGRLTSNLFIRGR